MEYRSQFGQDRWIAKIYSKKQKGYFIDVGAHDGIQLSNSYVLETELDWNGLCVEPGEVFKNLKINRRCAIDNATLYDVSGKEVDFWLDAEDDLFNGIAKDLSLKRKHGGHFQKKETTSPTELLHRHDVPYLIDYLSIDTEGSEFKILSTFPFGNYRIGAITVEHNYQKKTRHMIYQLLRHQGFVRVRWQGCEDWYLHPSVIGWKSVLSELGIGWSLRVWNAFRSRGVRVINCVSEALKRRYSFRMGNVSLNDVIERHRPQRVVHIGAHTGEEAELYSSKGVSNVVWIEGDPEIFPQLQKNVKPYGHICVEALVSDKAEDGVSFWVASNNGASSSLFPFGQASRIYYPRLRTTQIKKLSTTTLDKVFEDRGWSGQRFDLLVLDLQGAEKKALRGMKNHLRQFPLVLVEYSTQPLYEGGTQLKELEGLLISEGYVPCFQFRKLVHGNRLYRQRKSSFRSLLI